MSAALLPYVRARSMEYLLFGLRAYLRRRPPLRRHRPVFSTRGEQVALTVDDGPDPRWTPALLDVLAWHGVPATFFLIGARAAEHPGLARRIAEAGHTVGNHSMTHPQPFAALDRTRLDAELDEAQERIADAVGAAPRLFRAPGGGWSPRVLSATAAHGLTPVDWTLNTSDWKEPGVGHITRMLRSTAPGHVVLCHDGGGDRSQTVAALDAALPELMGRGLRFVALR